ncbi:MAG: VOC family protein [Candidatus Pacebacteria bacterium]|nr:VOC family protein [Candidatus Paceibacterota bacterium]
MQKITPCLWFDKNAEEAVNFYVSIFKNSPFAKGESKIGNIARYGKEGFEVHHMPEGTVLTIEYRLDGQNFLGLNGGPVFHFDAGISFIIDCKSQEEVDYFWEKLTEGGDPKAQQCGWLKDKFGLSWQVVPDVLGKLLADKDKAKAGRVMTAMLQMKKIVIKDLETAYEGK